jgi:hypothetical protein
MINRTYLAILEGKMNFEVRSQVINSRGTL